MRSWHPYIPSVILVLLTSCGVADSTAAMSVPTTMPPTANGTIGGASTQAAWQDPAGAGGARGWKALLPGSDESGCVGASGGRTEFRWFGTRCEYFALVEAPGFAPGSENTSSQESTMRIRLCSVAPGVKRRKNRRAPTPESLATDVRDGRQQPAYLNDIHFQPAG